MTIPVLNEYTVSTASQIIHLAFITAAMQYDEVVQVLGVRASLAIKSRYCELTLTELTRNVTRSVILWDSDDDHVKGQCNNLHFDAIEQTVKSLIQ